jgi:hypothetical protein
MATKLKLIPGSTIRWGARRFVVVDYVGLDAVIASGYAHTLKGYFYTNLGGTLDSNQGYGENETLVLSTLLNTAARNLWRGFTAHDRVLPGKQFASVPTRAWSQPG